MNDSLKTINNFALVAHDVFEDIFWRALTLDHLREKDVITNIPFQYLYLLGQNFSFNDFFNEKNCIAFNYGGFGLNRRWQSGNDNILNLQFIRDVDIFGLEFQRAYCMGIFLEPFGYIIQGWRITFV